MNNRRYSMNRTKFLTEPEAESFESLIRRNLDGENGRDALMLGLALRAGPRAQELLNISRNDYLKSDHSIYIRGIKGSNDREVPLPDWLATAVERYIKRMPLDQTRFFPIEYTRLRQIWVHWRPVPKKLHSLRHTFAIRTYLHTRDVRLLQVALGHRSINNTMIYVDYIFNSAEMKRIVF